MPYLEVSEVVKGDIDKVYAIVSDMQTFPDFMEGVTSIDVLESGENMTLTKWVTNLEGRTMSWIERDLFYPAEHKISYQLTEGDLRKFEGDWILEDTDEGIKITLTVDFEFGIPMFAALLNPIAKIKVRENCDMMLQGIKKIIEN